MTFTKLIKKSRQKSPNSLCKKTVTCLIMNPKSLCYKLKHIKKIQFKIKPANGNRKVEKLDVATIKQIPKPPHEPLENPEFQQHARKEMKRTQKKIEHIQQQKAIVNSFPEVKDIPARDN